MGRFGYFIFSFILLIILGYGGLVWFVNTEVEKGLQNAVAEAEGWTLRYDDLWVDISDHTVTLSKPVLNFATGEYFTADEVIVHAFDERHARPHFIKAEAKGLVVEPDDAKRYALPIDDGLRGDAMLDYRYTPEAKALTINEFSFDDVKYGLLRVSGTLTELDLDAFRMEELIGLRIKNMEVMLTDREVLNTAFAQAGRQAKVSGDLARQQASHELMKLAKNGEQEGKPRAAQMLRNLRSFVDNSGTVTLKAEPTEPVPYIYLFMGRDIFDNIDLLNLSVEAQSAN